MSLLTAFLTYVSQLFREHGRTWQNAAENGIGAVERGKMWQNAAERDRTQQSAAECGSTRQNVAECDRTQQNVACIHTFKRGRTQPTFHTYVEVDYPKST